jgi:hypothetical protein
MAPVAGHPPVREPRTAKVRAGVEEVSPDPQQTETRLIRAKLSGQGEDRRLVVLGKRLRGCIWKSHAPSYQPARPVRLPFPAAIASHGLFQRTALRNLGRCLSPSQCHVIEGHHLQDAVFHSFNYAVYQAFHLQALAG